MGETLRRRRIGRTQLQVSELGLGAASLGNLYHAISDEEARATLTSATSAGIDYVDTAPFYGFGLSERRVGDALRGTPRTLIQLSKGLAAHEDHRDSLAAERGDLPLIKRPQSLRLAVSVEQYSLRSARPALAAWRAF